MAYLNREQILGADDRETIEVEVTELGGSVRIRSMSGAQVAEYTRRVKDSSAEIDIEAISLLVSLSLVDEAGNRIFTEADIPALGEKSMAVLIALQNACIRANGLDVEAEADDLKKEGTEETG